jgi:hypothetical protein
MGFLRTREQRRAILLKARLHGDEGWSDVTICNVSSRGLMVECPNPPSKGAFVELRRGACCIVGHVRWSRAGQFGLRSQDRIDLAALAADPQLSANRNDRRSMARERAVQAQPVPIEAKAEHSRQIARALNWIVMAVVGVAAALLVAQAALSVLGDPLRQVRVALEASH